MTDTDPTYDDLTARLGYQFNDLALLIEALIHPSLVGKHSALTNNPPINNPPINNQRLEFLGDRVLGIVIADWLFELLPDAREGLLTQCYIECVDNRTVARIARGLGLGDALKAQEDRNLAKSNKVLADALEAVLGAVWRDGGIEAVRPIIHNLWGQVWADIRDGKTLKDNKTRLQEHALAQKLGLPEYETLSQRGYDHAPRLLVAVMVAGRRVEAQGNTRRKAEQNAAGLMLEALLAEAENATAKGNEGVVEVLVAETKE